jgi:fucose permease
VNVGAALVWGGVATVSMTALLEGAMYLGWTRMSLPFILGTAVTSDRRKAAFYGAAIHMMNGLLFAFGYAAAFQSLGRATWWIGALLGVAHTGAALVLMPFIAGVHPRMATEVDGPDARNALQPPGFFALNYGRRTPLFALTSHLLYGIILGALYPVA